jgi:hypothetical protein
MQESGQTASVVNVEGVTAVMIVHFLSNFMQYITLSFLENDVKFT